jgi:drug/metabolite transporter (DMT)-like permease
MPVDPQPAVGEAEEVVTAERVEERRQARSIGAATHLRGVATILAAALAFASLGTLSGIAYRAGMGSPTFVTVRAVVGTLLLIALIARNAGARVPLRALPGREQVMLFVAVVANACLNLALFAAYGQMAVALVLAVYFTYPMLVALGSVAIGRERFTPTRVTGLVLAAGGVGLVLADQLAGASLAPLGLLLALAAALCQSSYLVVSRAGYTRVPAEQATALMLGGGALLAGAVALAVDLPSGRLVSWVGDPAAWAAVIIAGALGAAAAKVWLLRGVRLLGATRTAVLMLTEPVGGVILAALVLGQAITPLEGLGGAIILGAALLVQRPAPGPAAPSLPRTAVTG